MTGYSRGILVGLLKESLSTIFIVMIIAAALKLPLCKSLLKTYKPGWRYFLLNPKTPHVGLDNQPKRLNKGSSLAESFLAGDHSSLAGSEAAEERPSFVVFTASHAPSMSSGSGSCRAPYPYTGCHLQVAPLRGLSSPAR